MLNPIHPILHMETVPMSAGHVRLSGAVVQFLACSWSLLVLSLLAPVAEVTLALPAGRFPGCTGHFSVLEKTDCPLSPVSGEDRE